MQSLKGYIPALARLIGMTPAALYERQRALVRDGLLDVSKGRGPGTGVRTSAGAITLLLIAALASESLSETGERTRQMMNAKPVRGDYCPVTLGRTFFEALGNLLLSPPDKAKIDSVKISRTSCSAEIGFKAGKKILKAQFAHEEKTTEPALKIIAILDGSAIREIATDLKAILEETVAENPEAYR